MSLPLIPNNFNYYSLNAGIPAYLIPESGTVLTHVNATDLHNGTAKVGGAWTQNGTVTFNSGATPNPSVGPFSDSNYFSQTSSSPANVANGPFTVVMLTNQNSTTAPSDQIIMSTGTFNAGGFYAQMFSSFFTPVVNSSGTDTGAGTSNGPVAGAFTVSIFGLDASGNLFSQLNGGTTAQVSGAAISASTTAAMIGRYIGGTGYYFNGNIYEVMVSTAVPSGTAFTAIYNAVIANTLG
jgi:hypothetical protein